MRKTSLVLVFSAFLLTMCRAYAEPVSTLPGLSCRAYTDTSRGLECSYTCPDGTVVGPFQSAADPSLSATKGDLDRQLCGIAPATFTPGVDTAAATATDVPTVLPAASPTAEATLAAEVPVTGPALLTGRVMMCDLGANLINFRMVQSPPDVTGKTITAQIGEGTSACYVNPTNPSLLTCTLPAGATFPARIVVSLEGAVVGDFTYTGIGCEILTTALPTTTP